MAMGVGHKPVMDMAYCSHNLYHHTLFHHTSLRKGGKDDVHYQQGVRNMMLFIREHTASVYA